MYLLAEQGNITEPYINVTLFNTEKEALDKLNSIVNKINEEFNSDNYEIERDTDYFYITSKYGYKFIELLINELEPGKEIQLR